MPEQVELSVVIPVYNSEKIFPELYRQLTDALPKAVQSFQIVAVVDGCRDRSFEVIQAHAVRDPRVKVLEFSRNFGHQAAVTAGLEHAAGALVAIMDDDLEDPPAVLAQMIAKLREGYDVVYGIRRARKRSIFHRLMYHLFYRILNRLVDVDMPSDAGDFCVMRRRVADVLNSMSESNRYLRGLRAWVGFNQVGVEYERGERYADESGYTFRKYMALATHAIFSFSYKPLSYVSRVGLFVALTSFAIGIYLIVNKLTGRVADVPGWVSLLVSVLMLSGVQLISIGILGQYLMRVYDEVKKRPAYSVKRAVGFEGMPGGPPGVGKTGDL